MAEAQRQDESPLVFTSAAAGKVAELIEEIPLVGVGSPLATIDSLDASASFDLPVTVTTDLGSAPLGTNDPTILVTWPSVFTEDTNGAIVVDPSTLSIGLPGFGGLADFQNLTMDDVFALLDDAANFVEQIAGQLLNQVRLVIAVR